jgi:non-specific serine/threonine protein kinase
MSVRSTGRPSSIYLESLEQIGEDDKQVLAGALAGLAGVLVTRGEYDRAARVCGAVSMLLEVADVALTVSGQMTYDGAVNQAWTNLGNTAFDAAWAIGRTYSLAPAIAEAVSTVAEPLPRSIAVRHRERTKSRALTARELEVLRLLAAGLADRGTAAELGISPRTVETHVTHILVKLGLPSRIAAVAYGIRHGLI